MSALSSVNSAIGGARRRRRQQRRRTRNKSKKIRSEMVYMARDDDDDDAENALVYRWSVKHGGAMAMRLVGRGAYQIDGS